MHIHILGICGTFMGGIAVLAREMGYTVSGSDANVYSPRLPLVFLRSCNLLQTGAPASD